MSGLVGMGTVAFGSNVIAFLASDGITDTAVSTAIVECTPAGATDDKKESGDVVDFGGFTLTGIADDTVDIKSLVGTTETTTITYPLGENSTPMTESGDAFLVSAPRTGAKNTLNTYAFTFEWKAKPTITVAT